MYPACPAVSGTDDHSRDGLLVAADPPVRHRLRRAVQPGFPANGFRRQLIDGVDQHARNTCPDLVCTLLPAALTDSKVFGLRRTRDVRIGDQVVPPRLSCARPWRVGRQGRKPRSTGPGINTESSSPSSPPGEVARLGMAAQRLGIASR